MEKNKERILCSAIIWNGTLIPGYRHSDCYELLKVFLPDFEPAGKLPHGFLTSHKRYVGRKEGYKIAKENDQLYLKPKLDDSDEELVSEDLYFDPDDFFGLTQKIWDTTSA